MNQSIIVGPSIYPIERIFPETLKIFIENPTNSKHYNANLATILHWMGLKFKPYYTVRV
jgi:hypothetical protein